MNWGGDEGVEKEGWDLELWKEKKKKKERNRFALWRREKNEIRRREI